MDKPKCWVKKVIPTKLQLSLSNVIFLIAFLTQHLGLSIFDLNLGWNNPAFFRVYVLTLQMICKVFICVYCIFPYFVWICSIIISLCQGCPNVVLEGRVLQCLAPSRLSTPAWRYTHTHTPAASGVFNWGWTVAPHEQVGTPLDYKFNKSIR